MKENISESETNIINTSSKDEVININPPKIIPVSLDKPDDQQASIESITQKEEKVSTSKVPGRIGQKSSTELSKDWKSCFKRMTVQNILKFQKKEITEPLLRMETEDDAEASKQMFRNMLSYMGDRKSSKAPVLHAKKYVKLVLIGNQILRDEAYLQIYKQLHDNPKYSSLMRGWKLMAIMSSCFVPKNKDIYNIILNYLFYAMQEEKEATIINHIRYIFVRMIRIKGKERHHVPSEEELNSIEKLVSIELPVKFFTGNQTVIKVESYTTIKCEKKSGTEERFIDDAEKVCDILSVWSNEIDAMKKKGETCKFHLYLKLLIYYPFEKDDIDTLSVVYYQTVYDVISGKHPLNEEKIVKLAALQLVVEFEDDDDKTEKKLKENLHKYIPTNKYNLIPAQEWIEKVFKQYKTINDKNKNDCKWDYLELLKDLPTYQMQQFNARFNEQKSGTNEDNIPSDCIIGLCPDGIKILDREHNEIVFYRYETIMNWGISKNQLIISISTSMNEIKRAGFFTSQTKVIQALIEIHCNLLVGKTLRDVQDVVKNYDTKFESIDSSRRIHSLMYKDDGSVIIDDDDIKEAEGKKINVIEDKGEDNIIKTNESVEMNSLDNINNIPQQVIPPNEE